MNQCFFLLQLSELESCEPEPSESDGEPQNKVDLISHFILSIEILFPTKLEFYSNHCHVHLKYSLAQRRCMGQV